MWWLNMLAWAMLLVYLIYGLILSILHVYWWGMLKTAFVIPFCLFFLSLVISRGRGKIIMDREGIHIKKVGDWINVVSDDILWEQIESCEIKSRPFRGLFSCWHLEIKTKRKGKRYCVVDLTCMRQMAKITEIFNEYASTIPGVPQLHSWSYGYCMRCVFEGIQREMRP